MKRRAIWILALLLGSFLLPAQHGAAAKTKKGTAARKAVAAPAAAQKAPRIAPEARAAIGQMGRALQALESFRLHAVVESDGLAAGGAALPTRGTADIALRQPDRLRVEMQGEVQDQGFFYDGQLMALHDRRQNLYALVAASPRLDGALSMALDGYGLDLPLVRMLDDAMGQRLLNHTLEGESGASVEIGGVLCRQFTFHQQDVDWQIWIAAADPPLPRKLSIVAKRGRNRPRFSAVLDWDPAAAPGDEHFTFEPPPGAARIAFVRADSRLTDKQIARREGVRRDLNARSEEFFAHYPVIDMARAGLAEGTVVASIPAGCGAQHVGGVAYQYCGRAWYMPQFVGTRVTYVVVGPPL